jgi:amino acid transporter
VEQVTSLLRKENIEDWEDPGDGEELMVDLSVNDPLYADAPKRAHKLLGSLMATAICANDITSSCLYTAAFVAELAGVYAFISLLMVAVVLYLYRWVYGEVGCALPLNGGTYTLLLNTTRKWLAALAGVFSFLSYVATAVVSGASAIQYGGILWGNTDPTALTIALLALFCILTLLGVTESAVVAVIIFVVHLATLSALIISCFVYFVQNPHILADNWNASDAVPGGRTVIEGILLGFGAGMLGITGFETSANFLEEQKPGVFLVTLKNMWIAVTVLNPSISFLAFTVLPSHAVREATGSLLAEMGRRATGSEVFYIIIAVDALLVLSGAVLTGYVGVVGLVSRLCMDRCLPHFLLRRNPWTHTHYFIVIGFFAVCTSLVYAVGGVSNITVMEGVYTVAFLSVMSFFAIGNMIVKYARNNLPRDVRASWPCVLGAFAGTTCALLINVIFHPLWLLWFMYYFLGTAIFIFCMFQRIRLLRFFAFFSTIVLDALHDYGLIYSNKRSARTSAATGAADSAPTAVDRQYENFRAKWRLKIGTYMRRVAGQRIILFIRSNDVFKMNKALQYVRENEESFNVLFVHVYEEDPESDEMELRMNSMRSNLHFLDESYPTLKLDLVFVRGTFNSVTLDRIGKLFSVPRNFMFMTCPGSRKESTLKVADFAGVRIIAS